MKCARPGCEREFRPYMGQRYCSWVCQYETKLERDRQKRRELKPHLAIVHRVCKYARCQKPFVAEHPMQVFCTRYCCNAHGHSDGVIEKFRRERYFARVGGRDVYYARKRLRYLERLANDPGYAGKEKKRREGRLLARRRAQASRQIAEFARLMKAVDNAEGGSEVGTD